MTELLPIASGRETWRALRALVRPHRWLAAAALAVLVAATAAGLLLPPIIGHVVDVVRAGRGPGAVTDPAILLAVVAVAQALLTGLGTVLVARLGETVLARLRERVVRHALGLPLAQVERAGSGDLVSRVSGDVTVIATAVRSVLPALAGAALTVGLTVVGLAALDWRFAIAGLLAAPIQLHTLRWYLRRSTPVFAQQRVAEGARTQQLLDSIGGADTVRAFRLGGKHIGAVAARSRGSVDLSLTANRYATRFFGRLNLAEFVGLALILLTGYWLVRDHAATVGAAAAAALYFHRLFDPINTLLGLFGTAQQAVAGLARLVGIAHLPPPRTGELADIAAGGELVVADVDFGYSPGQEVLHDVTLRVADGEHVAVVGTSGAGKTTLAKLVAGVHRPDAGDVRIGGVAVDDLGADVVRRHVALVTQEVHVFAGPLAADLRLAAPDATDEQLWQALETVGAAAWVRALPGGLATGVGEGAHRLSAAQAQQLALARLVLVDPAVAVLDEATADAGSAGARELDRSAAAALRGRSALIVAHRLSQAAAADRVIVLDDGRIVEAGTPDELVAAGGRYARLWQAWTQRRDTAISSPRSTITRSASRTPRLRS